MTEENGLRNRLRFEWSTFVCAYQFLTRIPAPPGFEFSEAYMQESARYYPLVGALVGGLAALSFLIMSIWLPVLIGVIFATILTVYLTGAFHEDGFADYCDGIGGGRDAAHTLEIMRDSRLGTYGTVGLVLLLLLKLALLAELAQSPELVMAALVLAHCLSRTSSVMVIATSEYVRLAGTAKPVAKGLSQEGIIIALLTTTLIMAASLMYVPLTALLGAVVLLIIAHLYIRRTFERPLGGYTGDTLGATQQVSEVAVYLGILLCI